MDNIHPADRFRLRHLSQISLGGLQILVPEDHLGDYLQRHLIPTRIGSECLRRLHRSLPCGASIGQVLRYPEAGSLEIKVCFVEKKNEKFQ